MTEAVIVATARTPIGRAFKGSLKDIRPDDLSVQVVQGLLAQVPGLDPTTIDDLYWGCADPSGKHGSNLARVIAVLAGMDHLPAATINRFCASSTQTMRMAFHAIKAGEGDTFVVGGVECVSQYTSFAGAGGSDADSPEPPVRGCRRRAAPRWPAPTRRGPTRARTALLPDVYLAMGQTAENVATSRGVSRQRQDEWGVMSQNRAEKAIADGFFAREILPVTTAGRHGGLDRRRPARRGDPRGGAGAQPGVPGGRHGHRGQLLPPQRRGVGGRRHERHPRQRARADAARADRVDRGVRPVPEIMGLGPVEASSQALARAGMTIGDMDLYEINEAFAAQVLPSADDLGMDLDRLNVHGGAIALGHPFGSTGTRIMTTLLNGLEARDGQLGLETMCVGGGQGMAIIVERLG